MNTIPPEVVMDPKHVTPWAELRTVEAHIVNDGKGPVGVVICCWIFCSKSVCLARCTRSSLEVKMVRHTMESWCLRGLTV